MELNPGAKLGPYEILSRIGAGGMGQVWKARDTRLNRIVAIKISAAKFSERFAQEARAIAALNHPHICTLHDVGPDYLVMEYVEGPQIGGPLPLDRVLRLAIELASALEAAHRQGITHRDLKPGNILVTKSGIKVLDFGLAKIEHTKEAAANDQTLTKAITQEGSIVGTLQYMAPEQLQGKATDARADIFSFGCVLYEMLTGKRAFDGANTASVIAAIMDREPPPVAQVAPPALDWALRRCLAKDPDERWQSARDLRAALERVSDSATEVTSQLKPDHSRRMWIAAIVVVTLAAVAVSAIHFREKPPETPVMRFSIAPPEKNRFARVATPPAVSPDGRQVVFAATSDDGKSQLWLRPLDSLTAQPLAGTENAIYPFWSPDNKSIGFFAAGKLKKMDVSGGPATTLADASQARGGTWSHDGVIVFAPTPYSGLQQVPASGGVVRPATRFDTGAPPQRFPWFLPDGRHFLYLLGTGGRDQRTIRIGSLDSPGPDPTLLGGADSSAMYAQGHLLFVRGTTLVARPFDAKRLAFTGEEVPVAEHLLTRGIFNNSWVFSVSANGVLAYQSAGVSALHLTWLDRAGKRLGTVGDPGDLGEVQFSPDRRTAAVTVGEASSGKENDIWLYDVLRGLRTRFTFGPAPGEEPSLVAGRTRDCIQLQPDRPVRPLSQAGGRLPERRTAVCRQSAEEANELFARRQISGLLGPG